MKCLNGSKKQPVWCFGWSLTGLKLWNNLVIARCSRTDSVKQNYLGLYCAFKKVLWMVAGFVRRVQTRPK